MKRVVVTGIGVISSIGNNLEEFSKNLFAGKSGITKITKFDTTDFASKIAGEVKNFDPEFVINKKEMRRMDRVTQYAIYVTDEALKNSKIELDKVDTDRVGVIIASGIGGVETWENQHSIFLKEGVERLSPFFVPMMIVNSSSGNVAIRYKLKGPNFSIVSACASSGHAIADAYNQIILDNADIMVCGGVEASITPLSVGGFIALQALSTKNDEPEKASRPFDALRDGFVIAEGGAVLILESLEHALKRNAPIYAEITGYGYNDDAYHITAPDESGEGPAKCMMLALKKSGKTVDDVDYINAHGTSTKLNDQMETLAIKKVFKDRAYDINISSTKSMHGHLLGAASAVESIATILAIKNGIVPPTINYQNRDPSCDLNYTPNSAVKKDIKFALSNSFGFGGHNVTLAFAKYE
ncbi:MAG: 3-oxoacyl-[acyl-carrier-protein] synthase 2 [candidate division TA06 bacterium 32_111]|uniref:3-oxoacyl-[acyl-carrier-protein] synthase 2 n=2 Tax=Bacteria candidate phyla TaxID=1783234 RepID=A0A101I185_UNCT6|nr:MAG: 3-oxoacyl-[acyl-carrier-protein] synthase 2 [candidate division TA06 bacterium 32_111]KUK87152.1 MAG: 3-oxoacyl-[acyl-carrier-protein] synthase 2 [candidate division TA06 bacterium 34_109]HAF06833.1 beta-ketoacyl-[acyl-carrier-protein] synthase II [candidate division WOR-3 bacterium]HCP17086.1 beta-ketoacyl-[acyl-carrier-protein] synthase II [candidate division WOR-3 bacterium]